MLGLLQLDNYVSLFGVTVVTYDYFLTFWSEIRYIWCRPWTWVSTIFVLVRYVGLPSTIFSMLMGSSLIPGPLEVSTAANLVVVWGSLILINSADLVMILRVYAMWNRSKRILYLLVSIYVPQVIVSTVIVGVYFTIGSTYYIPESIVQLVDFSYCTSMWTNTRFMLALCDEIPRFILAATLLILAVAQTLKQSVSMYKATKQWQPNQYMDRLVKDGVIYFVVYMHFNLSGLVENNFTATNSNVTWSIFSKVFSAIWICAMMPRFIISVREMYDHDVRRGLQGVDTGFGVLSQPIVSGIAFADDVVPGQEEVVEGDTNELEAIRLEPVGDNTQQV